MNKRFSFTKIDNVILDDNGISRSARAVFNVLARHATATPDSFRTCFLYVKTIAKKAGYSERTVQYAFKELEKLGLIIRTFRRTGYKDNASNLFTIIGAYAVRYNSNNSDGNSGENTMNTNSNTTTPRNNCTPWCSSCTQEKTPDKENKDSINSSLVSDVYAEKLPQEESLEHRSYLTANPGTRLDSNIDELESISEIEENKTILSNASYSFDSSGNHIITQEQGGAGVVASTASQPQDTPKIPAKNRREAKYSYPPEKAPYVLRPVAEYLLFKTKRMPAALSDDELRSLRILNGFHTPARIMTEINKSIMRFEKNHRPLDSLTFCYIEAAMRNQKPTLPSQKDKSIPTNEEIREMASRVVNVMHF